MSFKIVPFPIFQDIYPPKIVEQDLLHMAAKHMIFLVGRLVLLAIIAKEEIWDKLLSYLFLQDHPSAVTAMYLTFPNCSLRISFSSKYLKLKVQLNFTSYL